MGWSLSDGHEEVLAGDAWVESPWSSYERPPLLGARSLPSDSIGWVPFDCAHGLLLCSWALFRRVLPVLLGCEPRSWMCVPLPVPLRPVSTWRKRWWGVLRGRDGSLGSGTPSGRSAPLFMGDSLVTLCRRPSAWVLSTIEVQIFSYSTPPEGKEFISATQLEILHNIDNNSSVNLEEIT